MPDPWEYILALDEELLQGGVVVSEWSACLVRDADTCFAAGAYVAAVITGMAAVEAHLRYERGDGHSAFHLIDDAEHLTLQEKSELPALRRYRNRWVHVREPWDDEALLDCPPKEESMDMAKRALRAMRVVLYALPAV